MGARLLNAKRKAKRRAHKQARASQTVQAAGIAADRRDGRINPRRVPNGREPYARG
jgi:hypothetical protein